MRLIQKQVPKYGPVDDGVMPPETIRQWRGVNTFDPLSIDDSYFTDMSNFTTDDFPALSVRPGYTVLGGAVGSKCLGLGVWKDQVLVGCFNDGTMRRWDGTAWQTITSGLSTTAPASFTNFQGNLSDIHLFMTNGVNEMKKWDGTTLSNVATAPAGANYIVTYQNRLWAAVGKELHACALDQPEKWSLFDGNDEDSYAKDIESLRGESINGLQAAMKKLTISLPNSIIELYGSIPSDFYTINVTNDEGFSNNNSAFTNDGELQFTHKTGLYKYGGGVLPDRTFSDIVKRYLTGITDQSASGSDGKRLYFTLSSNTTMVYDPRVGIESWSVWNGISPTVYAVMKGDLYIGDNQGRVIKLGGSTDSGTPISWSATTKPFTNRSIAQKQRWLKLWVMAELATGSTMNISLSRTIDGNDWEVVKTITGTGVSIERIIVPIAKYSLENTVRVKFSGTGWVRLHELTRQVRQLPLY